MNTMGIFACKDAHCIVNMLKNKFYFPILFVICLFTASGTFVLTQLVIARDLFRNGFPYSFFSFVHPDPLINLAPMFRDILDGHWWVSDGRVFEHITMPNLWSFLDPIIAAPLIFITKNVSATFLVGYFVSALATFCLIYILAKSLTRHRGISLGFTLVFMTASLLWYYLFPTSLDNIKLVLRTVLPIGSLPGEILLSKYVSLSIFPALPFFAAVFLSIYWTIRRSNWYFTVFAGVLVGLLFYMYLTCAIYILAALFTMFVLFVIRKDFKNAKKMVGIVITAFLVSSYYWVNFFAIRTLPHAEEFYRRIGGEITHAFRWNYWKEYLAYTVMAILVWMWGKSKERKDEAIFVIGFMLAAPIILNMQVITGFNPAPTAWKVHQFYFGFAWSWLILVYWLFERLAARGIWSKRAISAILLILAISTTSRIIYTELSRGEYLAPYHRIPKEISASLDWLDKNTPRDSVVLSPSLATNALIPVLTHNRVLMPAAVTTAASEQEIIDRLYVNYKLFGVSHEYLDSALRGTITPRDTFTHQIENGLPTFLFESYFWDTSLGSFFSKGLDQSVPEKAIREIVMDYSAYPNTTRYLLSRYRIDYFYVGPYERKISEVDFGNISFLEKVYDAEGVTIYKVKK